MARSRSPILLTAMVFLLLLGLAFGAVERARATPKGGLYRTLQAYVGAVRAGDAPAVRGLAPGFEAGALESHVEALQGLVGYLDRLLVSEDGTEGQVWVTWLDPRGRGRHAEVLEWRRAPEAGWRLERIQVVR